jgi:hypothetical protein
MSVEDRLNEDLRLKNYTSHVKIWWTYLRLKAIFYNTLSNPNVLEEAKRNVVSIP